MKNKINFSKSILWSLTFFAIFLELFLKKSSVKELNGGDTKGASWPPLKKKTSSATDPNNLRVLAFRIQLHLTIDLIKNFNEVDSIYTYQVTRKFFFLRSQSVNFIFQIKQIHDLTILGPIRSITKNAWFYTVYYLYLSKDVT